MLTLIYHVNLGVKKVGYSCTVQPSNNDIVQFGRTLQPQDNWNYRGLSKLMYTDYGFWMNECMQLEFAIRLKLYQLWERYQYDCKNWSQVLVQAMPCFVPTRSKAQTWQPCRNNQELASEFWNHVQWTENRTRLMRFTQSGEITSSGGCAPSFLLTQGPVAAPNVK